MTAPARKLALATAPQVPTMPHDPHTASADVPRTFEDAVAAVRVVRAFSRGGLTITSRIYGAHEAKVRAMRPLWRVAR